MANPTTRQTRINAKLLITSPGANYSLHRRVVKRLSLNHTHPAFRGYHPCHSHISTRHSPVSTCRSRISTSHSRISIRHSRVSIRHSRDGGPPSPHRT